ncbi:MAG: LysM peptidoglycan-binding domain-containing protein [Paracoccaceae bacterium]|jgi:nucleoid-associated protein YgaU|nr:LysM peptidoglycan-binding domain-containing protein [Paracoccaceae bacterium]
MSSKLGLYQSVAIGAVVVAVAGWAIYTQTDLVRPAPVIEAADGPIVVAGDDEVVEEVLEAEVSEEAESDADDVVEESAEATSNEEATSSEEATEEVELEATDEIVEEPAESVEAGEIEAAPEFAAPAFEVVRVESDGLTVIAGTGPVGWLISILVDGVTVETVTADTSGQFVAILDIGESDAARIITLSAKDGDRIILSDAQVIIAPVVRQVAEVVEEAPAEPDEIAAVQEDTSEAAEPYVEDMTTMEVVDADVGEAVEVATEQTTQDSDSDDAANTAVVTEEVTETDEQDTTVVQAEDAEVANDQAVLEVQESSPSAATESSEVAESQTAVAKTEEPVTQEAAVVEPDAGVSEETEESNDVAVTGVEPAPALPEAEVVTTTEDQSVQVETVEDTAPAVLLVENDSVTVLQPSSEGPQVLDELSIAAISYSDEGAVQLSGFSPAGFLRVYLNNIQITVLEVPEPGEWATELADVAPGIYTLRIDQVDADGQVIQRVETPFKREEPEKVVAAAQTRRPLISVEVVQPGSTLWAISREKYGSGVLFVRIFEANKDQIRNPDLIYPGQIFDLPAPPGAKKKKGASGQ